MKRRDERERERGYGGKGERCDKIEQNQRNWDSRAYRWPALALKFYSLVLPQQLSAQVLSNLE